ncbi:MAG TPA: GNAT family protein [Ilumatobacter sp.]|nr:GNAT family protein [Ilumatobacter sp.]
MVERLPSQVVVPSGRFVLRRYVAADTEPLGRAITASLRHLRTFMPWAAHEPLTTAARLDLFATWNREWEAGESAVYGMFAGDEVIGGTGLHRRREGRPDVVEIGYWVHVDHVRQGIASEAAAALTEAAFGSPSTTAVEIMHDPANVASRGVPAKLGYTYRGDEVRRGETFSVWTVTRTQWPRSTSA